MGHKRHYSHESDHHTKSSGPKVPTSRSKSYPRDERHRKKSRERREHKQHKHKSKKTEYLVENHPKTHHREKKKHEKFEKDKYNTEKYLKEKHKRYRNVPNQQIIKLTDNTPKHSHKPKESSHKPRSLLDLMNIEYYVAPVQVKQNKDKYRSKSGGEKRSKEREQLSIPNKVQSRSQDECKHKDERKHPKSHGNPTLETPTSKRRSQREKSDKKHRNKDKHSSKTGSSRKSYERRSQPDHVYSGLYKFFHLEKPSDSQEVDQVKHNVSSRNNSDEILPARNDMSNHIRKQERYKRKQREEKLQKKSEEDMKQYFLKIQNLIDEKLNTFFLRNSSIPSTCPQTLEHNLGSDQHNHERERKNHKKPKEIRRSISPSETIKIPIIATEEQGEIVTKENLETIHNIQVEVIQNKTQQKAVKETKSNENSKHLSSTRNNISDCSPKRSKTSVISETTKIFTPRKTIRTLECKTISIVSIAPQEHTERIGKVIIKPPDGVEEIVEKKKKCKRFKKYYNYCSEKQMDSDGNSSAEKSILSDSFKNVQGTEETKEVPTIYVNPTEVGKIFDLYDASLTPYWAEKSEQIWKPIAIFQGFNTELTPVNYQPNYPAFNLLNLKNDNTAKEPEITKRCSEENDGFIKVYSNRKLKCRESSSDSLLSKSSTRSTDHTKVNVKLILGPLQATKDSTKILRNKNLNHNYRSKAIDYLEHNEFSLNQQTEERMSRIERLLKETLHLEECIKDAKQHPDTFTLPRTFISRLLEEVSEKKTSEIGVGTTSENIDVFVKNKESPAKEKTCSHFSVQTDLLGNENLSGNPSESLGNTGKTTRDVGVDTKTQLLDQPILKIDAKEINSNVKDQYVQISSTQSRFEEGNKKGIKFQTSTRSLGISTSLPFLRGQRRTNLRTRRSGSVRGTADTNKSTVASLICLHKFHGERISSSNKSNSHSLNDYFIKPLISNSPRRSSLFLTKQYRTSDQSSYQKRKMYDEKMRRRMKRKCQHNKEFSPPVFEVRFVTVDNTTSQSNPFCSSKEVTRDYVNPTFEKVVQKTKKKHLVKKRYSRNIFSCAIRDVDMLWKSRRKRLQKEKEDKYSTSFVEQDTETIETKTDTNPRKNDNVADLKGVIDFICKSLVTYYHNANFRDRSKERFSGKSRSNKTLEELYYSDHFQKESSLSNSLTDIECRSSVSDSKYTRSTDLTSNSSLKCVCFNNSCPRLNSADSFFDYPDCSEKNINPTILGYALGNKPPPTESYKKKVSVNDVSLSEESGYASDRINKSDLAKEFFKRPNIAALLRPNPIRKTLTHIFSYQEGAQQYLQATNDKTSEMGSIEMNENDSVGTLADKNWSNTFDSDSIISTKSISENVSRNILKNDQDSKESDIALAKHLKYVKNIDNQEYLNKFNINCKSFSRRNLAFQKVSARSVQESKITPLTKYRKIIRKNETEDIKNDSNNNNLMRSASNFFQGDLEKIECLKDVKGNYQHSLVKFKKQPIGTQTDLVAIESLERKDNELLYNDPCLKNVSNEFNIVETIPEIMNVDILKQDEIKKCSQAKIHKSFNCLCCKTSSTEDQLFAIIERDLREIYEPTSTGTKQNSKSSVKSKFKKFVGIFFDSGRKRIKSAVRKKVNKI